MIASLVEHPPAETAHGGLRVASDFGEPSVTTGAPRGGPSKIGVLGDDRSLFPLPAWREGLIAELLAAHAGLVHQAGLA